VVEGRAWDKRGDIHRPLHKGDAGDDVKVLQSKLNKLAGHGIAEDGIYGEATHGAVRAALYELGKRDTSSDASLLPLSERHQKYIWEPQERPDSWKDLARKRRKEGGDKGAAKAIDDACPGEKYGSLIVDESERARVDLALACALVEQESGFRNIFGCDHGPRSSAPWCHQDVTKERVQALIGYVRRGGGSNGVGLTQLTSPDYIYRAESLGGAHLPRWQLRIGFDVLVGHMRDFGKRTGIGAYNGGPGNPQLGYADDVLSLEKKWKTRLS
jgi:hypothetical protein